MNAEQRNKWHDIALGLLALALVLIGEVVCYVLFPNAQQFTP